MKLNIQLFAVTIKTTITEKNVKDGITNTSDVDVNAYFSANNSSTYFSNSKTITYRLYNADTNTLIATGTKTCTLAIGGSVSKTHTFTNVAHNSDGSLNVKATWTISTGTNVLGNITESQTQKTATLTKIARGSALISTSVIFTTFDLDKEITLNTQQYLATAWHRLEAKILSGNDLVTVASRNLDNISNTLKFQFSSSELTNNVYKLMPNTKTATVRFYLYTFTDSGRTQQIGDTSIVWCTGNIPSTLTPSIQISNVEEAGTVPNWGLLIKSKSKIKVTLTASPSTGSTLTSYASTVQQKSYNTTVFTSDILTSSGTITSKVTDSRGISAETSRNYTVVDYYSPTCTASASRCSSTGTLADDGQYISYTITSTFAPVNNKNSITKYEIGYKEPSSSSYTWNIVSSNTGIFHPIDFDTSKIYNFAFRVTDGVGTTSNVFTTTISASFKLINYKADGTALAIGKKCTADSNTMEVALPVSSDVTFLNEKGVHWKEAGWGDQFKIMPQFSGSNDDNLLKIMSAVGGAGTQPDVSTIAYFSGLSGNMWLKGAMNIGGKANLTNVGNVWFAGYSNANKGYWSTNAGQVNTPTGSGYLAIKKASKDADGTPNNGVVLEYGSNLWSGQLYFGDNSTEGVYYNGWSNGERGTWKKLLFEDLYFYKSGETIELGGTSSNLALNVSCYVSSSTTGIYGTIITPKRLDNITSITMNSINVEARGDKGYVNSTSGYVQYVGKSGYTITAYKSSQNSIRFIITKSSAYTNVTNNTVVSLNGHFKITLS